MIELNVFSILKVKRNYLIAIIVFILCCTLHTSVQAGLYKRDELLRKVTGNTYYLDAIDGNDSNIGNQTKPWRTLDKAQSKVQPGDCVILKSGDYGSYRESDVPERAKYILYIADKNAEVHFDTITISNTSLINSFLIFHGINILPDWVDPASSGKPGANDPQYSNSTQATYAKSASPVVLRYAKYVKIIDCTLQGQSKYLTLHGAAIYHSEFVTIDHCNILKVGRGTLQVDSPNFSVLNNHIQEIVSSAMSQQGDISFYTLIEGNHGHNSNYDKSDDYCPRADGANYHGSAVSIRSDHMTVKNNIFHDGFNSSGIMTYMADGNDIAHYDNMLFENNLLYDIHNSYVFRIYNAGDNFIVRNNTFIGSKRDVVDGRSQYTSALSVHTLDDDGTPKIQFYNNIFIGPLFNSFSANTIENNNIFWSIKISGIWACEGTPEISDSDMVMTCSYRDNPATKVNLLFNDDNLTFEKNHGISLDFTLRDNSPAIGNGNQEKQPRDSLGKLDNQGFILKNITLRSAIKPCVGAYDHLVPIIGASSDSVPIINNISINYLQISNNSF